MDCTDLGRDNKKLWQYKDAFRSGEDTVELAHFAVERWQDLYAHHAPKSILDIGCGAGMIINLLGDSYPKALLFGIEKVQRLANLAKRNLAENGFGKRSLIVNKDIRIFESRLWPWGRMDLIVCNPPYRKELPRDGAEVAGTQMEIIEDNLRAERQVARYDFALKIENLARLASGLIAEDGCFCLSFPLKRESELVSAMERERLLLKSWQRLCGWAEKDPKIGLYCFTRWTGQAAVQLDDRVLRAAAAE